jgi:hypothetical protein
MSSATYAKIASPKPGEPGVVTDAVADTKQVFADATTARTEITENVLNVANAVGAFNQASLDAFTQASEILATGSQDLLREVLASSQTTLHETLSGFRSVIGAKTVKEVLELQIGFVRASATRSIAATNRIALAGLDAVEKTSAVLTARTERGAKAFADRANA